MKNVTNIEDHVWGWFVDYWRCLRCGVVRYSANAIRSGCSIPAQQMKLVSSPTDKGA